MGPRRKTPSRKVTVSKPPSTPKRARMARGESSRGRGAASTQTRGGASTSQAPTPSKIRSKQRHDGGNQSQPSQLPREEDDESTEEEEIQSELPLMYFGDVKSRVSFYKNYAKRKIHESKRVDIDYMSKHRLRIVDWIQYQGWSDLLSEEGIYYPTLVRIFHSNFHPDSLTSYVKGMVIEFGDTEEKAFEQLGVILGVPYSEDELSDEVDIKFILNELTRSNDHTAATSVIKAHTLTPEARILRNILASCILPKTGSRDSVTQKEAELLWKIMHFKKVNLPKEVFKHIIACNKDRKNLALPYASWLTGVFKICGVVLRNEVGIPLGKRSVIGETTIKLMDINVLQLQVEREDAEAREAEPEHAAPVGDQAAAAAAPAESDDGASPSAQAEAYSFQRREPAPSPPDVAEATTSQTLPSLASQFHSFQTLVMQELHAFHTILESVSAQQSLILHRQDAMEAHLASIARPPPPPPTSPVPAPPASPPPPAPTSAPL